jgi:radical SAM-linked protein
MRLRIYFSKSGALRYTGHLDLHSLWERTVRRAGLPLSYTQGFHPGPKIQLASALPLGFIGRAEIVDIWINDTPESLDRPYKELLQSSSPPGLIISSVEVVDSYAPALQTRVVSADYEVTLLDPGYDSELSTGTASLLAASSLPRERRGKPYDLRILVESIEFIPVDGFSPSRLLMRLSAREGATGRPEEVLDSLGIPFEMTRIERTQLILQAAA